MSRKQYLGVITVLCVMVALAAGLYFAGGEQQTSSVPGPAPYTLRLGHNMKEDSAMHVAAQKFAATVSERSAGQIHIDIFPDQTLGNDYQMVDMARDGELDILLTPTAKLSSLVPAMQYADLPFLFASREDAYALLDGEVGELLLAQLQAYGLLGVTFWENGFKQFTANRAIHNPEDFQGLKIRVMKSPIIMDQFKAFGARPIAIDFHETSQALQDGVVDGQENPLVAIYNMGFYKQQSHLILSNHAYLCYVLSFSGKSFAALPADHQKILRDTARELTTFQRQESQAREVHFLEAIAASGTRISTLTQQQQQRFRRATAHIVESYRSLIGVEILAKTDAYLQAKYTNQAPLAELVIGLNADMSQASSQAGLAVRRGMEMAVAEINDQGGLLGNRVRIQVKDHAGMAGRARENSRQFAELPHLLAIVGARRSAVELAVGEPGPGVTAQAPAGKGSTPNYLFRMAPADGQVGPFLVREALQVSSRVALLLENTQWGRSFEAIMAAALAEQGLAPVLVDWVNVGVEDLTPQISRLRAAGAEVLLLVVGAAEARVFVADMARLGWEIPIIAHGGLTGGTRWPEANTERVDVRFAQDFSFQGAGQDKKERFAEQYRQRYQLKGPAAIQEPEALAHAYDLVQLLALAVQQSGTLQRSAVRQAMEQIPRYAGLGKTFTPPFTPRRHEALGEEDLFLAIFDRGAMKPLPRSRAVERGGLP